MSITDLENDPPEGIQSLSIGRIVSVSGSQAIVLLDTTVGESDVAVSEKPEIGTLLKLRSSSATVLALVSSLNVPMPSHRDQETEVWIAELELVGELSECPESHKQIFRRGVSVYPSLGENVYMATRQELEAAYCSNQDTAIAVGQIRQDTTIPAMIDVDELLGKHFAILGTTGTGKSCSVALMLRSILNENPEAHVVLLDPHNEYAASFNGMAEVIKPDDLQLPYWFLTFDEIVEVLVGDKSGKSDQVEILSELIPLAKSQYGNNRSRGAQKIIRKSGNGGVSFSVDTPVPYRLSDLVSLIDDRMGMLEHKNDLWPLKQLRQRIDSITTDQRYAFMFGSLTVQDQMAAILGRLFRVPVNGKPISILQLTGLPSEIVNVVVSVLCRMTFDFGLWAGGSIPLTLVCEEAHRYIPNDKTLGFEPTRKAIARIAKEGRKYGVSLCIVSQRPSELDPTILSQCNTVFAMRMSNDRDQQIVSAAVADSASGMLEFLPSIGTGEAIAFGDGVPLPVRIRFDRLAPENMPKSQTALFTERWRQQIGNDDLLQSVVERWRSSSSSSVVSDYESGSGSHSVHPQTESEPSSTGQSDPDDFVEQNLVRRFQSSLAENYTVQQKQSHAEVSDSLPEELTMSLRKRLESNS